MTVTNNNSFPDIVTKSDSVYESNTKTFTIE